MTAAYQYSTATLPAPTTNGNADDPAFDAMVRRVAERIRKAVASGPVFRVETKKDLFRVYLDSFPGAERQYHNCSCCKDFIRKYGTLATISEDGAIVPVAWDPEDAAPGYGAAFSEMAGAVRRGRVLGVFLDSEPRWGHAKTGIWSHYALPSPAVFKDPLLTASQKMAEKLEDYRNVSRALGEFPEDLLRKAVTLLEADALYRSEKVIGPAKWLLELQRARNTPPSGYRPNNVTWRAVASAPAGFCHPRSSMVGTLLEDLGAGMSVEKAKARFDAKMHPLRYQRPQAAPSDGNIRQAEETIARLGLAPSLARRFARPDEVPTVWSPRPARGAASAGGVFGHLKGGGKAAEPMRLPEATMTWEKFARTVLPAAESISCRVASHDNFLAFTTAVHADAPPILKWDREDARNPLAIYLYHRGSQASQWGLPVGQFVQVAGVAALPDGREGVVLLLDGAKDTRDSGLALFPECLRGELHGIRSTIEAYSNRGRIARDNDPAAAGLLVDKGGRPNALLRVVADGTIRDVRIDRWD